MTAISQALDLIGWPAKVNAKTKRQIRKTYNPGESFTELVPWTQYNPESGTFLFDDGITVGVIFEVRPADAEARSDEILTNIHGRVVNALQTIPEQIDQPWILQTYLSDEPLMSLEQELTEYCQQHGNESAFQKEYIRLMGEHFDHVAQDGGLFKDKKTGARWGGRYRRVRMTLYRKCIKSDWPDRDGKMPADIIDNVATRLMTTFRAAGITIRQGTGQDFYDWMLPWLSPKPPGNFTDAWDKLKKTTYPIDAENKGTLPVGFDFGALFLSSHPESDAKQGIWHFDGLSHRLLMINMLRDEPYIGHFTLEQEFGEYPGVLFDHLPEGSVLVQTLVIRAQAAVNDQALKMKSKAIGPSIAAHQAREEADAIPVLAAENIKCFDMSIGVYLRAENDNQLSRITYDTITLLNNASFSIVDPADDPIGLDNYIHQLPFCYNEIYDNWARSHRLTASVHAAALSPLYGRGIGTGNPGFIFYNKDGYPLMFDPLNPEDRERSAHLLLIGPTGTGKSSLMNYLLKSMMAVHRPHLVIIDALDSFRLLGMYFEKHGLTVDYKKMKAGSGVSLPPFADAITLIEIMEKKREPLENRNLLEEMDISAKLMITSGKPEEEKRYKQEDCNMVRYAIFLAAQKTRKEGREQTMAHDVAEALIEIAEGATVATPGNDQRPYTAPDHRRKRAYEMGEAMSVYLSGLGEEFFDRPGEAWPDVDVTIIDLADLTREGYEGALAITYFSLMNRLVADVESRRHTGRPTIIFNDEAHITTTNPLLAPYLTKISKMFRKMGSWLWLATQGLNDFPDESEKLLSQAEFWICLNLDEDDIKLVQKFKDLTDEQVNLFRCTRKSPGQYIEGVILSKRITTLFRNIPPALSMAMSQTEQHEVAARHKVMNDNNLKDELDAGEFIAKEMEKKRAK